MFTIDISQLPEDGNTASSQNAVHIEGLPQTADSGQYPA
jgi:hypothetical protein